MTKPEQDIERRILHLEDAVYGSGGDDGIAKLLIRFEERLKSVCERLEKRDALVTKLLVGIVLTTCGAGLSFLASLILLGLQFVRFSHGG